MRKHRHSNHLLFQLLPVFFLVIVLVVSISNIATIRQFLIGALGEEANIQILTTQDLGELEKPWKNLAQGGESKDWSIRPIRSTVQALSPQYIRIDHLYDFYDIVNRNGSQLSFDFSKLDRMLLEIQSVSAIPYLSLSYTPPALATNGDITAPPNWNEWELVVQKTIEHVSGTRGIANVYYEVWNEPDLFGNYKTYGDRNYLSMYRAAAIGSQKAKVSVPFKIGGPASTALYKNWFDAILQLSIDENLPLDFFSWHRYSTDINQYRDDVSKVQEWLTKYPARPALELHLTEWGHDSNIDPGYDSRFGAIHTMAVSTELIGMVDKAFVFEIQDGVHPEGKIRWGRWGLLDSTGQPKPRYAALTFLDRLQGRRVPLLGKGSWVKGVASRNGDTINALLVNYDSNASHFESVPVTFKEIIPGDFIIEQQFFGGTLTRKTVSTTSAELRTVIPMPVNSAVFLRLIPQ